MHVYEISVNFEISNSIYMYLNQHIKVTHKLSCTNTHAYTSDILFNIENVYSEKKLEVK